MKYKSKKDEIILSLINIIKIYQQRDELIDILNKQRSVRTK